MPPRKLLAQLGWGPLLRAGRYHAMVHPDIAVWFAAITQSKNFQRASALGLWQRAMPAVQVFADVMRMTLGLTWTRPPDSAGVREGVVRLLGGGFAPA